ncbi:MAG TPA: DUF1801 domain-containing protein [Hanamia sp.]|nr:DUF1801 domain-containing protein [Hanamia sp.]
MKREKTIAKDINEYIAGFPESVRGILEALRATIKEAAPGAEETISYAIPAFKLKGRMLVYFAGFKNHIGLYPAPRGNEAFKKELSGYKGGKGTVQFPLNEPIPLPLVAKIVKFRAKENFEKAKASSKATTK